MGLGYLDPVEPDPIASLSPEQTFSYVMSNWNKVNTNAGLLIKGKEITRNSLKN
jgi:hypothetical protein